MSPQRRRAAEPTWVPPDEAELLVLRRQIEQQLVEADEITQRPYENSGWGAWDSNLGDLIERAFGPKSAQATSYHYSGGVFATGPDRDRYHSDAAYERAQVEWRNGTMARQIEAARGAVKAVDQELERRGAKPVESGLGQRDFAFVQDVPLRAIAARDHDELRLQGPDVVKARALLAGSIIEAALIDALGRQGFAMPQLERMDFVDLIDEAIAAKVIQKRTGDAAQPLRRLRNFVHPGVERREGRLRKVDADAAIALMNLVLEDLA